MHTVIEWVFVGFVAIGVGFMGYAVYLVLHHQEWVKQCEAKGGTVISMRTRKNLCLDVKEIKV